MVALAKLLSPRKRQQSLKVAETMLKSRAALHRFVQRLKRAIQITIARNYKSVLQNLLAESQLLKLELLQK